MPPLEMQPPECEINYFWAWKVADMWNQDTVAVIFSEIIAWIYNLNAVITQGLSRHNKSHN